MVKEAAGRPDVNPSAIDVKGSDAWRRRSGALRIGSELEFQIRNPSLHDGCGPVRSLLELILPALSRNRLVLFQEQRR
jgi:hypothetical protein